jgi:ribosomal protein L5
MVTVHEVKPNFFKGPEKNPFARKQRYNSFLKTIVFQDIQLKKNLIKSRFRPGPIMVINHVSKDFLNNEKLLLSIYCSLIKVIGFAPMSTIARHSINNFKLRKNDILGCKISLNKSQVYRIIDRLTTHVFPGELEERRSPPVDKQEVSLGVKKLNIRLNSILENKTKMALSPHGESTGSMALSIPIPIFHSGLILNYHCFYNVQERSFSFSIQDPFQFMELEDNSELFENLSVIEFKVDISNS